MRDVAKSPGSGSGTGPRLPTVSRQWRRLGAAPPHSCGTATDSHRVPSRRRLIMAEGGGGGVSGSMSGNIGVASADSRGSPSVSLPATPAAPLGSAGHHAASYDEAARHYGELAFHAPHRPVAVSGTSR
ncbi:hypothetical protein GCM10027294_50510 [Marinactinospora endophytica]